jgi:hypothetical protein
MVYFMSALALILLIVIYVALPGLFLFLLFLIFSSSDKELKKEEEDFRKMTNSEREDCNYRLRFPKLHQKVGINIKCNISEDKKSNFMKEIEKRFLEEELITTYNMTKEEKAKSQDNAPLHIIKIVTEERNHPFYKRVKEMQKEIKKLDKKRKKLDKKDIAEQNKITSQMNKLGNEYIELEKKKDLESKKELKEWKERKRKYRAKKNVEKKNR